MRILGNVTCNYKRTVVEMVGFKKYLLFGPRTVSHQVVQSGQMTINPILLDLQGDPLPEGKFEIEHEDKVLKGVCPYEEVGPGLWMCSVDFYDMKDPVKDGHIGLDRFTRHDCCSDSSCPSNN